jgi:hypothetical protein
VKPARFTGVMFPLPLKFLEGITAQSHRAGNDPHLVLINRDRMSSAQMAQLQTMFELTQKNVCVSQTGRVCSSYITPRGQSF